MACMGKFSAAIINLVVVMTSLSAGINAEAPEDGIKYVDMKTFIEKNQKLWVYKTTQNGTVECKNDHYIAVNESHTSFRRSFLDNGKVQHESLQGDFLHWTNEDEEAKRKYYAMELHHKAQRGDLPLGYEVFEYENEEKTCAVVSVLDFSTGDTITWRELRLNESIATTESAPRECLKAFEDIAREAKARSWRITYSSKCKIVEAD